MASNDTGNESLWPHDHGEYNTNTHIHLKKKSQDAQEVTKISLDSACETLSHHRYGVMNAATVARKTPQKHKEAGILPTGHLQCCYHVETSAWLTGASLKVTHSYCKWPHKHKPVISRSENTKGKRFTFSFTSLKLPVVIFQSFFWKAGNDRASDSHESFI